MSTNENIKEKINKLKKMDELLGIFDNSKSFNLNNGEFSPNELKQLVELFDSNKLPNLSKRFWFLVGDLSLEENYRHFNEAHDAFCNAGLDDFSSYQRISYFLEQKGTVAYHAKLNEFLKDIPKLMSYNDAYSLFDHAAMAYSFTKPKDKFQKRIKQEEIERLEKLAESAKRIRPIELEKFVKYTQK